MDDFYKQLATSVIRHSLTVVCGSLVTDGLVTAGDEASFVKIGTGIAVGLIGLAWSWYQKVGQQKLLDEWRAIVGDNG